MRVLLARTSWETSLTILALSLGDRVVNHLARRWIFEIRAVSREKDTVVGDESNARGGQDAPLCPGARGGLDSCRAPGQLGFIVNSKMATGGRILNSHDDDDSINYPGSR